MADPSGENVVDAFQLDEYGVNLCLALTPRPPGMWTQVQNGQRSSQYGMNGVEKRGGMAALNSSVLAGSILAMSGIPLGSPFDTGITPRLIAALREDTPLAGAYFLSSTTGGSFTGYSALTKPTQPWDAPFARNFSMYYVSSTAGDVALQQWNGTTRYQVAATFPDIADGKVWACCYAGGLLYVVVATTAAPAASDVYRVYSFNLDTGVFTKIGDDTLIHSVLGVPCGIQYTGGKIFVVGKGASNAAGVVYRYAPGVGPGTWTLEYGPQAREFVGGSSLNNCAVATISGRMVVSLLSDGVSIPGEVRQLLSGAWSTLFTCPGGTESVYGFAVHGSVLLEAVATVSLSSVRIYADGVQELDISGTYGATACMPGASVVWSDGCLYWAWYRPGSVLLQGFILKRTAAGVWSQADTGRALSGALGMIGV